LLRLLWRPRRQRRRETGSEGHAGAGTQGEGRRHRSCR
jgi:hypothetical protein